MAVRGYCKLSETCCLTCIPGSNSSKHLVDTHYARWGVEFSRVNVRRATERQALRAALKAGRKQVGLAGTALSALRLQLASCEFFEIPCRPAEPPGGTWDDGPYVSSMERLQNLLLTAEIALADTTPALAEVSMREKDFCGFADLSRLKSQRTTAAESLDELLEPHLRQLEQAWAVDDDAVEIVLEHAPDTSKILPPGQVVRICSTRPLDEAVWQREYATQFVDVKASNAPTKVSRRRQQAFPPARRPQRPSAGPRTNS